MPKKKLLSFIIGLAISALFLFLILRNVNINELTAALKSANYIWLLPNIFFVILAIYQRAERWKFMLNPIAKVKYKTLLAATSIGFMANNILPLRLGEFVRAYSLSKQDNRITKSASLATIFIERMVFDLLALLIILVVILAIFPIKLMEDPRYKMGALISLGIAVAGLIFAIIIVFKPERSGRLMTKYLFFLPDSIKSKIELTVMKFSKGLLFLKKWKETLWVSGHTMLIWICMGLSNLFVLQAFGFDLPVYASYVLLVVVSISILIPSSPGFIGVYHAGVVFTLSRFGIDATNAVSCSLVLHAAQYIPITLMGFYFLKKEHLSLKQLKEEALEEDEFKE